MHLQAHSKVKSTLEAHGKSIFPESSYGAKRIETEPQSKLFCSKKDTKSQKLRKPTYPNTFNVQALDETEAKAMRSNFKLHKNLFSVLFKKFAERKNSENFEQKNLRIIINNKSQLAGFLISIGKFGDFLSQIDTEFSGVASAFLVNVFRYVRLGIQKSGGRPTELDFSGFEDAIFQFAYYWFNRDTLFRSPLKCFQLFLEKMSRNCNKNNRFDNDYILNVNADPDLVTHFMQKLKADPETRLPKGFELITKPYFESEEQETSISREPKKIVTSILYDLIMEKLDIFMKPAVVAKKSVSMVRQIASLTAENNQNCNFSLPPKIEISRRPKFSI